MTRKVPLVTGEYYHVYNQSIAGFKIFNGPKDYARVISAMKYYQFADALISYSRVIQSKGCEKEIGKNWPEDLKTEDKKLVNILAYCIMPTHMHFQIKQNEDNGISEFMRRLQNSYARYFNLKYKRKGPLWSGKFKALLVKDDNQFLHLSRYIHLNPVTAYLVENAQDWKYSSYRNYIQKQVPWDDAISNVIDMSPEDYKMFVEDNKDYQRELGLIKDLFVDEY